MKKVYIIHGWGGYPEEGWFPWIKTELEKKGYEVFVPKMPDADYPKIEKWIPYIQKIVGKPDKDIYFIGHSIGCQGVLRYLESLDKNDKAGGVVLVAPWMYLDKATIEEEGEESVRIAKPWVETPINWNKIKLHTNKFTAIFSDDDPFVPMSNSDLFKEKLNARIIIEHNLGHINGEANITKLPSILEEILRLSK